MMQMQTPVVNAGRKPKTQKLWCAKDNTYREVPVDSQFNGGQGIGAYLQKRDDESGKPVFYTESQRLSMDAASVSSAMDFSAAPMVVARRADDLIGGLLTADPATLKKAREILLGVPEVEQKHGKAK